MPNLIQRQGQTSDPDSLGDGHRSIYVYFRLLIELPLPEHDINRTMKSSQRSRPSAPPLRLTIYPCPKQLQENAGPGRQRRTNSCVKLFKKVCTSPSVPIALGITRAAEDPDNVNPSKWHAIAKHVPNRTNKDCRKRWFAKMSSDVVKGGWSPQEDEKLVKGIERYGTRYFQLYPSRVVVLIIVEGGH